MQWGGGDCSCQTFLLVIAEVARAIQQKWPEQYSRGGQSSTLYYSRVSQSGESFGKISLNSIILLEELDLLRINLGNYICIYGLLLWEKVTAIVWNMQDNMSRKKYSIFVQVLFEFWQKTTTCKWQWKCKWLVRDAKLYRSMQEDASMPKYEKVYKNMEEHTKGCKIMNY